MKIYLNTARFIICFQSYEISTSKVDAILVEEKRTNFIFVRNISKVRENIFLYETWVDKRDYNVL